KKQKGKKPTAQDTTAPTAQSSKGKGKGPAKDTVETIDLKNEDVWEKAANYIAAIIKAPRIGDEELAIRAAEMRRFQVGHATVRFAGPGSIEGVVNLTEDPNDHDNPRELCESHVQQLADVFKAGGKRDLQSPIWITIPRGTISDRLQRKMKAVDITDPTTKIPALTLIRPQAEEEDKLELEIWWQTAGQHLLGTNDLADRMA
ncbi:hypothetical protein FRC06_010833, partial [Ceratobasidium sp. 370]